MSKDAPFDPCKQWLGFDAVNLGNARLVLGVSQQEADPSVITRAADARLNLLRTISPGPFEMARAGLIKRVEEARDKLLAEVVAIPSPPRFQQGGQPAGPVTFAMPAPPSQAAGVAAGPPSMWPVAAPGMPPAVPSAAVSSVPPVPPTVPGRPVETIAIRTTVYRKKTPVAGLALTVLALSTVAGGLFYYSASRKLKSGKPVKATQSSERETVRSAGKDDEKPVEPAADHDESTSEPPLPKRNPRRRPRPESLAAGEGRRPADEKASSAPASPPMQKPVVAMAAEKMPEQMPVKVPEKVPENERRAAAKPAGAMAEKNNQLDATLVEALEALHRQDDDTFMRLLAAASEHAKGQGARERVASWKLLGTHAKGFWESLEKALAAVKPGDEYDVQNQKISVVKVDDETFVYRTAGGDKTVVRKKIPAGVVLAIVTQWFDDDPANQLSLGAYHLAKPESDPRRARDHWEQASAAGADVSGLLPLLDDPLFAKGE